MTARASLERDRCGSTRCRNPAGTSSSRRARRRAPRWPSPPASMRSSGLIATFRSHPARPRRPACRGSGQRDGAADLRGLARSGGQRDRRGGRCGFRAARATMQRAAPTRSSSMPSADEEPEPLIGNSVDLGLLATEFLILGVDPYPRKPDAAFEAPAAAEAAGASVCGARRHGAKRAQSRNNFATSGPFVSGRRTAIVRPRGELICIQDGLPGRPWPKRSELRSMPWGATSGLRSWFPAPTFRSPAIPTRNSSCSATRPWSVRCSTQRPRLKAASRLVHTDVVVQDGRQAEPGAAPGPLEILDVARNRRGEEGRGRCRGLGRQHRRPDGDGEVQPAHHAGHRAPGDRRRSGRRSRATRSCSMSAPRSAPTPTTWSISP